MEASEENVQQLLAMGFPDPAKVRRALRLARNDLSEAVAILTNEHPSTNYDTLDDVEMRDTEKWDNTAQETLPTYGPFLPPTYEEAQQQIGQEAYSPSQPDETLVQSQVSNFHHTCSYINLLFEPHVKMCTNNSFLFLPVYIETS